MGTVLELDTLIELSQIGGGLLSIAIILFYFIPKAEKREAEFKKERESSAELCRQERIAITEKYEKSMELILAKNEVDREQNAAKIERMYEQVFEVTREYSAEIKHLASVISKQGDQITRFSEMVDPVQKEVQYLGKSNELLEELIVKTNRNNVLIENYLKK